MAQLYPLVYSAHVLRLCLSGVLRRCGLVEDAKKAASITFSSFAAKKTSSSAFDSPCKARATQIDDACIEQSRNQWYHESLFCWKGLLI